MAKINWTARVTALSALESAVKYSDAALVKQLKADLTAYGTTYNKNFTDNVSVAYDAAAAALVTAQANWLSVTEQVHIEAVKALRKLEKEALGSPGADIPWSSNPAAMVTNLAQFQGRLMSINPLTAPDYHWIASSHRYMLSQAYNIQPSFQPPVSCLKVLEVEGRDSATLIQIMDALNDLIDKSFALEDEIAWHAP